MPNAMDVTATAPESILAIGAIGVGKTSQFLTLPGKKFIYLFDPNALTSLKGYDVDYEEFRIDAMDLDLSIKSLKKGVEDRSSRRKKAEPKTYVAWEKDFEEKLESGFFEQYDWVGIDSFTTFSDCVMDRIQYLNGRLGKHPEQTDYTALMTTTRNVFRALHGIGKGIYATAHVELKQNELSGRIFNQIMMTGRLRVQIPLLFTQVLYMVPDKGKPTEKGMSFNMQTAPDRENPTIRCTFEGVQFIENVTIDWKKDPIGQGIARFL